MKKEELSKALGDISADYIEEAEDYHKAGARHTWAKVLLPLAACLAIAAVVVLPKLDLMPGASKNEAMDQAAPEYGVGSSEPQNESCSPEEAPSGDLPESDDGAAKDEALEHIPEKGESGGQQSIEPSAAPEPADEELVLVRDYIPTIQVDLRYATENNFTGQIVYDFTEPQLRYGTVKKLAEVQEELLEKGFSLKIWDGYRPVEAQFKLWEICPDGNFVADPTKGFSSHSRGNTVDVTLVLTDGTEVEMPTDFDDFTALADRDYSDVDGPARENAELLEEIMESHGFQGYKKEWWHFSDEVSYPVVE